MIEYILSMNPLKKLINVLEGFVWGTKATADEVFTQQGAATGAESGVVRTVTENRVSKDLLRGEVTQAVEELRYRTFLVEREAKKYEYYSPLKAIKRDADDLRKVKYDDSDGLEVITIQPNRQICDTVFDGIKDIDFDKSHVKYDENVKSDVLIVDMKYFDTKNEHTIKIKRDFMPRFKLEDYCSRIVVKKLDDTHAILDLYFSQVPIEDDMKSIYFSNELKKIYEGEKKSDILMFDELEFLTSHAYKMNDYTFFKFDNIFYRECVEYEGNYILKFKAHFAEEPLDIMDTVKSKTMEEKYKNNEKKEVCADMSQMVRRDSFVCEECGKTVYYDAEAINESEVAGQPRYYDEEVNHDNDVAEYLDVQMAEQTFGKKLCRECMDKYSENVYRQWIERNTAS